MIVRRREYTVAGRNKSQLFSRYEMETRLKASRRNGKLLN